MRTEFRKLFSFGPGGIRCNCCRPCGCHTKKAARLVINRLYRRFYRRVIAREITNYAESAD